MLASIGTFFSDRFRRWIPESFIFALLLTFLAAILAITFVDAGPFKVVQSWYKGFWLLLSFAMQMALILVTGYAIAISPPISRFLDWLATKIKTPMAVYVTVVFVGCLFILVSWGWIVITAVLARELALRVKKVDYRLLAACVYITFLPWHSGLSGSIPLMLNTPGNFLVKAGTLSSTIPTTITLLSPMNIFVVLALIIILPVTMAVIKPSAENTMEYADLLDEEHQATKKQRTVEEEAESFRLPGKSLSDALNNSFIIQIIAVIGGLWYLVWHFSTNGFDINLNIMNFLFIMVGMLCHKTPIRYVVALKRACGNISGIVLQFPFYAGIMGIMIYTGLGTAIAMWIAGAASIESYPFVCFIIAGVINMFVPSGGGEWAVVGPTIVEAAKTLGATMPVDQLTSYIARCSMAVAYGDSWTNMIQPFWTLAIFPVLATGTKMQARDVMGYSFIALIVSFFVFSIGVTWLPM